MSKNLLILLVVSVLLGSCAPSDDALRASYYKGVYDTCMDSNLWLGVPLRKDMNIRR